MAGNLPVKLLGTKLAAVVTKLGASPTPHQHTSPRPRTRIDYIVERFRGFRRRGEGYDALCPAHDDTNPSLSIDSGDDGRVLVHCHAGCSPDAVLKAVGLTTRDLFPVQRMAVATYDYRDEQGELLYQVCRMDPKGFRQRRPDGQGGWAWAVKDVRKVLYRLPELLTAEPTDPVFVAGGEKDADRLASLGLNATTNAGGAGKWVPEFSESLRGRTVVILPDNDDPGRDHADTVARSLCGVATRVSVVALPDLPAKGDVSDWLDARGTRDELLALVAAAPPYEPIDQPDDMPSEVLGVDPTGQQDTQQDEVLSRCALGGVGPSQVRPFPVYVIPNRSVSMSSRSLKQIHARPISPVR